MVSLGCAKNLVDSEMVLGMLKEGNYIIVNDPEIADVIIVNTCGFIESAKEESINTILEMTTFNKKLIVMGCLVERYLEDLKKEIPEVNLFIPLRDYHKLHHMINGLFLDSKLKEGLCPTKRVFSTPSFSAYLRISDGCDNCCTYCAIPLIRGRFKSRPVQELIEEARIIAQKWVKELVVISQDTTKYGIDLPQPATIVTLLRHLLEIKEFAYIRLLYLYPDEVTDDLLHLISQEKRLTPYFDLPIQHASSKILKSMNRRGDQEFLRNLMKKIRNIVPDAILRTTLIIGFPGETDDDFKELLAFVEEVGFDHLGAFAYSREEDTTAYDYIDQVDNKTKQARLDKLMKLQRRISFKKNKQQIGRIMTGIVTAKNITDKSYELRSEWNAPDDIDGKIIFTSKEKLEIGEIVDVRVNTAFAYDLYGEHVNKIK